MSEKELSAEYWKRRADEQLKRVDDKAQYIVALEAERDRYRTALEEIADLRGYLTAKPQKALDPVLIAEEALNPKLSNASQETV